MEKVIIIGNSCHIGKWLMEDLRKDFEVVGLSRRVVPGYKTILFNLLDEGIPQIEDVDYCLNLAAITDSAECERNPRGAFEANVLGIVKVLEALKTQRIKKFIYFSTGSIYGYCDRVISESMPPKPRNIYALTKYEAENICRYYSRYFPVAIMRLFSPYGPLTHPERAIARVIRNVKDRNPVVLNRCSGPMINPIYIEDLVKITRLAMVKQEIIGEFNLAGPDIVSIGDIARIAGQILNIKPKFRMTDKEAKNCIADTRQLIQALDYSYKYGIREGIAKTVEELL